MIDFKDLLYFVKWFLKVLIGVCVVYELRMWIILGMIESGIILLENMIVVEFLVSCLLVCEVLKIFVFEKIICLE